ncbi:hypothetical protein [Roseiconus lacunae]|uniref:DUF4145 domain-containing protein n=1 Tax=Roseiconus lacunae TaxID=2605694 RepID=A0ABT7PHL5_9BACT|nr:hypothetical protein [Roseiconus lacunae]MDM4015980.1 hypothetical protein [Roseiconus lacunae]
MSWEKDPLVAKAKLFFGYAFGVPREDPRFGLYAAMGLELLARGAVASVSPTLLAEPSGDHKHLLYALGRDTTRGSNRSIGTSRVLQLCQQLFSDFTNEDRSSASALVNRRNDELHSGVSAFSEYTTQEWIAGFYRCCSVLAAVCDEDLESIFGVGEAKIAKETIEKFDRKVLSKVKGTIAAHKKVFASLKKVERDAKIEKAKKESDLLAYQNHHRVKCPACGAVATVEGQVFGAVTVMQELEQVVTKQAVMPESFSCVACGLELSGFSELVAADLGDQYTRTIYSSPEEYYGLVNPESLEQIRWLAGEHYGLEYNNE